MILSLLETAGNRILSLDDDSKQKLRKLHGKTVAVEIKTVQQTIYVMPTENGIEFHSELENKETENKPDVTLKATLGALVKISRDGMEDAELQSGELEIEGDAVTGQRFAGIITELDIDWEELLAQQIGDIPAQIIGQGAKHFNEWAKDTRQTIKQNTAEYLIEELRVAAPKHAVETFLDEVDILRADVDRLYARIQRLKNSD